MSYYFTKFIQNKDPEKVFESLSSELAKEGFGILSDIKVNEILNKKLNNDLHYYRILGACHPEYAYQAIKHENKIGTMLPCNFIIQELEPGRIEISAVDPVGSMASVDNNSLGEIAQLIRTKIKKIIDAL